MKSKVMKLSALLSLSLITVSIVFAAYHYDPYTKFVDSYCMIDEDFPVGPNATSGGAYITWHDPYAEFSCQSWFYTTYVHVHITETAGVGGQVAWNVWWTD